MMLWIILGFLVQFMKKEMKSANLGNFRVLRRGVGIPRSGVGIPRSSLGPCQGVACPRRGVAEREVWTSLGTPRRSYCSQHRNFCVLFCFSVAPKSCLLD